MQAQAVRSSTTRLQATVTAQQSLQSVQTLLQAGLGCIAYLRDLLPEENFSESYLTSSSTPGLAHEPSQRGSSVSPMTPRQTVSSFTIRSIKRGFTEEADQLLNCLERGIFDALERQYLKSFVFAIYLDDNNPNKLSLSAYIQVFANVCASSLVESYTFNFNYFEVDGTGVKAPVMSLGEGLVRMSLDDPAPATNKPIKPPTLGEVKKSLRSLARRLIHAASQMDELPKRRFAAFKLYYYDHTPDDYEPPHFRKGDADKDKWYFTTHDKTEVPERTDVGRLETGWHSVEVQVASITSFLPSPETNKEEFSGMARAPGIPSFPTPLQEAEFRRKQAEAQLRDAEQRKVVFDADPSPVAEITSEVVDPGVPLGVMDDDGNIVASPTDLTTVVAVAGQKAPSKEKIVDVGHAEKCVTDVRELVRSLHEVGVERTQVLPSTQPMSGEGAEEGSGSILLTQASALAGMSQGVETQVLKNMFDSLPPSSQIVESEMLDLETQQPSLPREESIGSSTGDQPMKVDSIVADRGLDCCCEVDTPAGVRTAGAGIMPGVWGSYHNARDKRIPTSYQCFDCRIRSDKNWDLIVMRDQHLILISDYKDFAIFRRAIKIAESMKNFSGHLTFVRRIGCPSEVAMQLFRRLQTEGFVVQVETATDELGLMEIQEPVKGKRRRPRAKAGSKYKFVAAMKKSQKYKEYFDPEQDIKMRLERLGDLDGPDERPARMVVDINSQTQLETQPVSSIDMRQKRKSREDQSERSKRVKISVGGAMDLGD
ncbi:HORMA-domain-containing protein [Thelephora terrestris]|uniref:HORMA-domain-containing protein n=1 Tax=Thelephora terrestris TaxID=56493 RepID=A0A9P6HKZ2_9AGAM|nr:HORMA-domain-containing protein [Thelephora terrestris]